MLTNASLTVYHNNGIDATTHYETWKRCNYSKVWFSSSNNASIDKGYANSDNAQVRIPYDQNEGLDIGDFEVGDIFVKGTLDIDIQTQEDLAGYEIHNITSIKNNDFGDNQHIHITGE